MLLQIESPNIKPDENLMDLVHRKFEHLGRRYYRINNFDVVLRKEINAAQKCFFVEAKAQISKMRLFASERAETIEGAIENVINKLEHQLRRVKGEREEIW
jgi:ribosomal subunit interface protein